MCEAEVLERTRDAIRTKHGSRRTEDAYLPWIRRFLAFHGSRPAETLGTREVAQFLTYLAVERDVAASTQNQALNALVFLYKKVLGTPLGDLPSFARAKQPETVAEVLTKTEVKALLERVSGVYWLMASLLYGAGLRLIECLRLRVKDVDFERAAITVRRGKGEKDRVTMLPTTAAARLPAHLEEVRETHRRDLAAGHGKVYLLYALERKYPNANSEWGWQYVFPSTKLSIDPRSGVTRRHHADESSLEDAVKDAARAAGLVKHATPRTLVALARPCASRH